MVTLFGVNSSLSSSSISSIWSRSLNLFDLSLSKSLCLSYLVVLNLTKYESSPSSENSSSGFSSKISIFVHKCSSSFGSSGFRFSQKSSNSRFVSRGLNSICQNVWKVMFWSLSKRMSSSSKSMSTFSWVSGSMGFWEEKSERYFHIPESFWRHFVHSILNEVVSIRSIKCLISA